MDWQNKRTMNGQEYAKILIKLDLNHSAAARYLGVSSRTSRRYCKDEAEIPEAHALLLRSLLAHGERPVVPPWTDEWEQRQ